MKKRFLLPLLLIALMCVCSTAFAASISGQQSIAFITDATGNEVTALTDDDNTTVWTKSTAFGGVDLTVTLYDGTVGEIWIRSGYAYTYNWYSHYDRPDVVKVTVYYQVDPYTESCDVYRYRLADEYRPDTIATGWNSGYQRLLLPKQYTDVTKIELSIESAITGYGSTGATISDLVIASGSHATATPKSYATATPKPYVVYVTPTPGPETDEDDDVVVEIVTAKPSSPTATPYIENITPTSKPAATAAPTAVPEPTATPKPIDYPTDVGTVATLLKRIATRTGPSNYFDEPGSFFSAGDQVKVITRAWDDENEVWWFQVEFYDEFDRYWYRAYTTCVRIDLDPELVPMETDKPFETLVRVDTPVYYGPGTEFRLFKHSVAYAGYAAKVYNIEGEWAQIEYYDYATEQLRRGWVALVDLVDYQTAAAQIPALTK